MQTAADLSFELVATAEGAEIYIQDHGKDADASRFDGKLTVLNGADKSEAPLNPAGANKLEAKGVTLSKGAKAVAVLTTNSKKSITVRFTVIQGIHGARISVATSFARRPPGVAGRRFVWHQHPLGPAAGCWARGVHDGRVSVRRGGYRRCLVPADRRPRGQIAEVRHLAPHRHGGVRRRPGPCCLVLGTATHERRQRIAHANLGSAVHRHAGVVVV